MWDDINFSIVIKLSVHEIPYELVSLDIVIVRGDKYIKTSFMCPSEIIVICINLKFYLYYISITQQNTVI